MPCGMLGMSGNCAGCERRRKIMITVVGLGALWYFTRDTRGIATGYVTSQLPPGVLF